MAMTWLRYFWRQEREGFLRLPEGRVWFRRTGKGRGTPLVVIHGGPGFPHDYLASLGALSKDRPVIFYDQLGCGRSDKPHEKGLWTLERFLNELKALLRHLRLRDYVLLGHSWGAMLALDHALQKPVGLRGLVLASPIVRMEDWLRDINSYRTGLPADARRAIERAEQTKSYASPEFLAATNVFYAKHVFTLHPWPEPYARAAAGAGHTVYRTMWGPTEFIVDGTLRAYDRHNRLHEIAIPTLYTCGGVEAAKPETMETYAAMMPDARVEAFQMSAHMPHLEETERYLSVLGEFLSKRDRA